MFENLGPNRVSRTVFHGEQTQGVKELIHANAPPSLLISGRDETNAKRS